MNATTHEMQAWRTLVVGLGKTGVSIARHLSARGETFAVADSRENPPGVAELRAIAPHAPLYAGAFAPETFVRAKRLVISPGVAVSEPAIVAARARGAEVLGDIELFARAVSAPVVAITGSNGKSTVTTLVGEMAKQAGRDVRVGGNLGTPALDLLGDIEPDLYVLELSSFQLETTHALDAVAATVLNVSPDHLDRYRDVAEYAQAKERIYRGGGVMVVNADDAVVMAMVKSGRRIVRFGACAPANDYDYGLTESAQGTWLARGGERLMRVDELRIKGVHNALNALAALALGEAAGLPMQAMIAALKTFAGLPHRTQWLAEIDGVTWFNDSKGTNVGATEAALRGMPGKVVLIAGGLGKGQDFTLLRVPVATKARAVVLIGQDAPLIAQALRGTAPLVHAKNMDDAVAQARALAQRGDCVLLSPACASFDMFSGYDERGRVFMAAVERLRS